MTTDLKLTLPAYAEHPSANEERHIVQSYHLGVNAYVVEPVRFGKFIEAVGDLGLFWAV